MKLDYKAKKRSLWFKKKSFEVMNTVSRVAPGCNFFFERERMKVLMGCFIYILDNSNSSLIIF